jgi:hypothetical protein
MPFAAHSVARRQSTAELPGSLGAPTSRLHEGPWLGLADEAADIRWRLSLKFSSGVTLKELGSIANVLVSVTGIDPPGRAEKRKYNEMVAWFGANWAAIEPWMPLIALRDRNGRIIDGEREMIERRITATY